MSSLSPETRALIDAARDADRPTPDQRAQLREALVARLGIGAAAVAATTVVANGSIATAVGSGTASTVGAVSAGGGSATMTTASAAGAVGATKAVAAATGLSLGVKIAGAAVLASAAAFTAASISSPSPTLGSADHSDVTVAMPSSVTTGPSRARDVAPYASATSAVHDLPLAVPGPSEPGAPVSPAELPNAARAERRSSPSGTPPMQDVPPMPVPSSRAAAAELVPIERDDPSVVPRPTGDGVALPSAPESTIGAETALLRRAHTLLVSGDARGALALLDEHGRTFPSGVLAEERDAERVAALCASGQVDRARAEATRFIAAHPGSAVASRVRRTCESR